MSDNLAKARAAKAASTTLPPPAKRTNTIRTGDNRTKTLTYSRAMAIKLMCMDCCGWEQDPNDCTDPQCPLFPFKGYTKASMRGVGRKSI